MYGIILSDDLTDDLMKCKLIDSNIDTIIIKSCEFHFLEDVKDYLERIPRTTNIIKSLTIDQPIHNYNELFRIIKLNNYTILKYSTYVNDIICIEGLINYYNKDILYIKNYHNTEYNSIYLDELRNIFGDNII